MSQTIPEILSLPKIYDPRGSLTFVEEMRHIPFEIQRVYWTYDVPGGESRGGHAHRELHQLIVAVNGSFDVTLTDGYHTVTYTLNRPYEGLYVPPGFWRSITNFSSGSVLLALVSLPYDEAEYIRDFEEFSEIARARGPLF